MALGGSPPSIRARDDRKWDFGNKNPGPIRACVCLQEQPVDIGDFAAIGSEKGGEMDRLISCRPHSLC